MPESRNWADLPTELVHLIYNKLPADRIYVHRFRAVCKNWRSSAPLSDHSPQLPWLIEFDNARQNSYLEPGLRFYSLAGDDTSTIRVPERFNGMVYYGPGHGYLLVLSPLEEHLYLLDPITADVKSLPYLDYRFRVQSPVCSGSDPIRNWHIALCHMKKPASSDERWRSVIYRPDKNSWKYVHIDFCRASCNTCCWDGKLFATEAGRYTKVFDVITGNRLYKVPPPEAYVNSPVFITYLVESCGEILRVSWNFASDGTEKVEVSMFDIYKLYSEGEQHSWVEVYNIGDQILFLDMMNGFTLRAPDGFKGNCIYFLLDDGSTPCRYDIGTGAVEMLPCYFHNCTWFIPNFS